MSELTTQEAVAALDAIDPDDPEGAHSEADQVLLSLVDPEVRAALERLVSRSQWWAYA